MPKQVHFYENVLQEVDHICSNPEKFATVSQHLPGEIKGLLKKSYDFTKNEEDKLFKSAALPELITENFDLEQIWQQLELQNNEVLDQSVLTVSRVLTGKNSLLFNDFEKEIKESNAVDNKNEETEKSDESESSDSENSDNNELNAKDIEESDDEQSLHESDESQGENEPKKSKNKKKSVVDDKFFKLQEMENFLNAEESKLGDIKVEKDAESSSESEDEGSIDLFKQDSDDEKEEKEKQKLNNPRYKDFFREQNTEAKKPKRNKFFENEYEDDNEVNGSEEEGENQDESEELPKSSLQLREERLKRKIEHIEEKAISEKPWQLKGEVTAEDRPPNSLLEEIVDFELTTRPAPVITEETSLYLEDVIRQRIKDRAFDSVIRKAKPVETPLEYRKKLVLDQEKSKESLAQIYEKEYLKQKESLDPDANEKEEEEPQLHKEIKKLMSGLFTKLDALSNFHFTPKPAMPELKIVNNLPAINIEEVAPVATSDAALLAPEEIKNKPKADPIGKGERTATDKKRERRKKKLKQKVHAQLKKKREESKIGLGIKHNKNKTEKEASKVIKNKNVEKMDENYNSKSVKSSTAFFTQLQEEVQTQIKSKIGVKRKKQKNNVDAKKIKL